MPLTTETGVPPGARRGVAQSNRALVMLIFGSVLVAGTGFWFRHMAKRPGTVNQAALGTRDYQTDGDTPGEAVKHPHPLHSTQSLIHRRCC